MATAILNFHGPINHPATTRLRNAVYQVIGMQKTNAAGQPIGGKLYDDLLLMLNSTGGSLDDGFSLYGFLRTLPIKLTTVNMGTIASIAIVPFLAGMHRVCCPHAIFHFHDFEWNDPAGHTMTRPQYADHTQLLHVARDKAFELLKLHTSLVDADFKTTAGRTAPLIQLLDQPVIKDAVFAKEKGIVQEIGFPQIPADAAMFNVDY